MKKTTIAAVAASLAFPLTLLAGSDYIHFQHLNDRTSRLWIDDLKQMSVIKTQGIKDGYNTLVIEYLNGETKQILMGDILGMEYRAGLLPSQMSMTIAPHHNSVTLDVKCSDPTAYWQVGALPASSFEGKSEHEWDEVVFDYERNLILSFISQNGGSMSQYTTKDFFYYQNDLKVNWFPSSTEESQKMPGSDYVAYAYRAEWTPSGPVFSHDVLFEPFTAKPLVVEDVTYDIDVELTANSITANVTPGNDEPYAVFILPERDVQGELDDIARSKISAIEYAIYSAGLGDWEDYTSVGKGSKTQRPVCSGEKFYVVVAGCEYGVMTSHAVRSELITVPYPEVSNNCTFDVTSEAPNGSELNLTITPSDDNTRYVVFQKPAGKVTNPVEYFTQNLYYLNTAHKLDVNGDGAAYVHTGAKTINNMTNVFDSELMTAGTEYIFYVMGIDEYGTPTTAIKEYSYTPQASEEKMTLTLNFDLESFDTTSAYYRYLWCDITPSDKEAKYVFDKMKYDASLLSLTDEEIINKYIKGMYGYVTTVSGDQRKSVSATPPYGGTTWDKFYIVAFGWDGAPTSDLYMYEFDPNTAQLTPLRGPDVK